MSWLEEFKELGYNEKPKLPRTPKSGMFVYLEVFTLLFFLGADYMGRVVPLSQVVPAKQVDF